MACGVNAYLLEEVAGLHVEDADDDAARAVVADADCNARAKLGLGGSDEVRMAEQGVPGDADGAEAADRLGREAQQDVLSRSSGRTPSLAVATIGPGSPGCWVERGRHARRMLPDANFFNLVRSNLLDFSCTCLCLYIQQDENKGILPVDDVVSSF